MTQHGGRPTGEHRSHPVTEPGDASVADRVHPAVETMKPPDLEATIDRARTEPQLIQLPPREHSVLPSRQLRHGSLIRPKLRFTTAFGVKLRVGMGGGLHAAQARKAPVTDLRLRVKQVDQETRSFSATAAESSAP